MLHCTYTFTLRGEIQNWSFETNSYENVASKVEQYLYQLGSLNHGGEFLVPKNEKVEINGVDMTREVLDTYRRLFAVD